MFSTCTVRQYNLLCYVHVYNLLLLYFLHVFLSVSLCTYFLFDPCFFPYATNFFIENVFITCNT